MVVEVEGGRMHGVVEVDLPTSTTCTMYVHTKLTGVSDSSIFNRSAKASSSFCTAFCRNSKHSK